MNARTKRNYFRHRQQIQPAAHSTHTPSLALAISAILYAAMSVRDATAAVEASNALDEIIVTARKREENLQDVPQSIEVFTRREMEQMGIVQFDDYALRAPSIDYISLGPGQQHFFIRGVSDGSNPNFANGNTATTGFLVDDLSFNFYGHIPDVHMYDIERVEVLNGPQGTLYGAGSMAGAVRVITRKPDPSAFSSGVDFDGGRLDGGGNNWTYEGFLNLPLIDGSTAMRLSAFSVHQGGYIDNLLGTRHWLNGTTSTTAAWAGDDFNTQDIAGGRIALHQELPDNWKLDVSGFFQRQEQRGEWQQDPQFGARNLERFGPSGGYDYQRFFDLHAEGDAGIGDIVYALGYWSHASRKLYDYSEYAQYSLYASTLQAFACATDPVNGSAYSGCKVPYMYADVHANTKRWSNELRLQSKVGGRAHWVAGAYWENTVNPYSGFIHMPNVNVNGQMARYYIADNLATPLPEEYYSIYAKTEYLQTTEFGDLSVDLDPRWSIEAGVEHFHSRTTEDITWNAAFYQQKVPSSRQSSSQKNNFKGGVNFKPIDQALLYLSYAEGFRDGGFNDLPPNASPLVPTRYSPDTLKNYEFGWKTAWWDGRLRWDGAVYYMRWVGYQVPIYDPLLSSSSFNANIGDARIYGAESSLNIEVANGLHVSASTAYDDARLLSNRFQNPDVLILPGERLPFAAYFNYAGTVRYERPLGSATLGYVQFDVAHKGDMWNDLRISDSAGFTRFLQPAYNIGALRLGTGPSDGHWQAEGYISNLWNTRAVVFANYTSYSHPQVINEPRVFGVRLKYRWGKID